MLHSFCCRVGFGSRKESSSGSDFDSEFFALSFNWQFSSLLFTLWSFSQLYIIFATQNRLTESATSVTSVFTFPFPECEYAEHQRMQHRYPWNFCSELSSTARMISFLFPIFWLAFTLKSTFLFSLLKRLCWGIWVRYMSENTLQIQKNGSQISFI